MSNDGAITGNKGEWSEFYVFLKVLGDGCIFGADGNIEKINDVRYDVNKIFRNEGTSVLTYIIGQDRDVISIDNGNGIIGEVPIEDIINEYHHLFSKILLGKSSFPITETEHFMQILKCTKIKAPSSDKTDILLEIREPKSDMHFKEGFSIKSMLGSPSTLINASAATNFIFSLDGGMTQEIADEANSILSSESKTKIIDGMFYLRNKDIMLRYSCTENKIMSVNLTLVDSSLPEIVSEMLKLYYCDGIPRIKDQVNILNKKNPMKYDNPDLAPYYSFKIKKMLVAYALGMQSSKVWRGDEEANGGYIVVKKDGEILCYHIFDRGNFEEYLINNTKLETASSSRHGFANIYKENNEYKIKLNFQVRFL